MIDFTAWRRSYDSLSYEQQQVFYDEAFRAFPSQEHHESGEVEEFLRGTNGGAVVEFGGWTGELAQKMLEKFPGITSWQNIEICRLAAEASVVKDERYSTYVPDDYIWNKQNIKADIFIAAHSIEHIKSYHLSRLLDRLRVTDVYFEAPLLEDGATWEGHTDDNHILDIGWESVHRMMWARGYELRTFKMLPKFNGTGVAIYRVESSRPLAG